MAGIDEIGAHIDEDDDMPPLDERLFASASNSFPPLTLFSEPMWSRSLTGARSKDLMPERTWKREEGGESLPLGVELAAF